MCIWKLHTLSREDIKTLQGHNIQQGQTELHHKHTSNKIGLLPHRGKYGAQDNLVHTSITGHDVTRRYKEEHNDQKGQMSYRPMSCFILSQEKDNNEGLCMTQGHCCVGKQRNTLLPPSPPPEKKQPDSSDEKSVLHQQTLYN
jgi:hypothetical protein